MRRFIYIILILLLFTAGAVALNYPGKNIDIKSWVSQKINPTYRLIFAGDIMLDRDVENSIYANGEGDWSYPFNLIAELTNSADLAFANLEGPISDKGVNQGSIYSFRTNPRAVEGLKYAGFDVLSIANNHILDWGKEALEDTIEHLRAEGIQTVGAGANYKEANAPVIFILSDGTQIAFLAYTDLYPRGLFATANSAGVSNFTTQTAQAQIAEEKSKNDIVVVSMHWGQEYKTKSNSYQQELAKKLIKAGADLIVGHHPHTVQEVSQVQDGWVAYSLGNFVFDQFFSKETMRGLVLEAIVEDQQIKEVNQLPVQLTPTFQPRLENAL